MFDFFKSDPRSEARKALRKGDYRAAGDRFKMLGDYDEALKAYLKGGLYSEAAILSEEQQKWDLAGKYWEKSKRYREAGEAYAHAGKREDALRMFQAEGDFGRARDLAIQMQKWGIAAQCCERINQFMDAAKYYYKAEDWEKASQCAEKHLAILEKERAERQHLPEWRRDFSFIARLGGASRFKAGDFYRSGELYAIAQDYPNALSAFLKAKAPGKALEMAVKMQDYEKGLKLIEQYPETRSMLELCAEVYLHSGQPKEAAKFYMAAQKPLLAAKAFEQMGNLLEAAFLYEQSMDYEQAVELYMKAQNWSKAAEIFRNIGNHLQAAGYFEKAERFEEAIEEYLQAQDYYNAGRLLNQVGDASRAITVLQKVDFMSPDYEQASLLLSELLMLKGQHDVALKRLEEMIEELKVETPGPEVAYLRARAKEELGMLDEALEDYQKVLSQDVAYKDAGERRKKIEKMKKLNASNEKPGHAIMLGGKYEILETLNTLAHLSIVRAIDKENNQPVLIKRVERTHPLDLEKTARLKEFRHPHVLFPRNLLEDPEELFLCMEYYEGHTLRDWMNQPHSYPEVADIMSQVAEALRYCHANGVIFGMIPPESVYLTKDRMTKINPWEGFLRLRFDELRPYAAPEYAQNQVLTEAADIYCLGTLFYEALYRQPPKMPLEFPSEISIPEPVRKLLASCLNHDPTLRPESIKQVIEVMATADVYPGAVIEDRYVIEKELGRGGMGRVYLATDRVLGEPVAIKMLNAEILNQPGAAQRLIQEIKIARKITHPNVVKVYEISTFRGGRFITMEYVNGVSLHRILESTGAFPLKVWLKMAIQIVQGLNAAHKMGIVHRDLKPQNILLTRDGTIKILDFGIARAIDQTDLTQSGTIFGSPKYMSPEQIQGAKVDTRSDLYSLGIMFYYMLTGAEPFKGDSVKAILAKQLFEPPPKMRTLRPDIPEPVEKFVSQLLEKNPENRFQNSESVLKEIESLKSYIIND